VLKGGEAVLSCMNLAWGKSAEFGRVSRKLARLEQPVCEFQSFIMATRRPMFGPIRNLADRQWRL